MTKIHVWRDVVRLLFCFPQQMSIDRTIPVVVTPVPLGSTRSHADFPVTRCECYTRLLSRDRLCDLPYENRRSRKSPDLALTDLWRI
jgi:hypothetical protein